MTTDSCSTGLGAAMALMTPTAVDVQDRVPFLGLTDPDFVLFARCLGGKEMLDGQHFDFFVKWYGDAPHLARSVRRNLAYESRTLLFVSLPSGVQVCAQMEELMELQRMMPQRDGRFLTEVWQINRWR